MRELEQTTQTPEHRARARKVGKANSKPIIVTKDGIDLYFESISSAANTLALQSSNVSKVLLGK